MLMNLRGNVFLAGSIKRLASYSAVRKMKKYASEKNCDVIVVNIDPYIDGMGKYQTIIVKEGPCMGQNNAWLKTIDFTKDNPFNEDAKKLDIQC